MSYIAWLDEGKLAREQVGGKGAALSDLAAAGFRVPPGFSVTADGYRHFTRSTGIDSKIAEILASANPGLPQAVHEAAVSIAQLVAGHPLPEDLQTQICEAYAVLLAKQDAACAVRSSAISEDGSAASFAGLYETYLNIRGAEEVVDRVHRCYTSLWSGRAAGYRARNGGGTDEAMAVVVMGLVPSETSGIAFTAHPVTGSLDMVVINSSWGLGEAIVSGRVTPDSFVVQKGSFSLIEREIYPKEVATVANPDAGAESTVERRLDAAQQNAASLSDDQACEVARLAVKVEEHYGSPQDVEWAMAGGELYVLQSRPITTL